MEHDPKAYLSDIKQACDEIKDFTQGMSFEEYSLNSMVKAAVERKFLVIGEAMIKLKREHTVWSAIKDSMPILRNRVFKDAKRFGH